MCLAVHVFTLTVPTCKWITHTAALTLRSMGVSLGTCHSLGPWLTLPGLWSVASPRPSSEEPSNDEKEERGSAVESFDAGTRASCLMLQWSHTTWWTEQRTSAVMWHNGGIVNLPELGMWLWCFTQTDKMIAISPRTKGRCLLHRPWGLFEKYLQCCSVVLWSNIQLRQYVNSWMQRRCTIW